jgi:hypothetical protein
MVALQPVENPLQTCGKPLQPCGKPVEFVGKILWKDKNCKLSHPSGDRYVLKMP